MTFEMNEKYCVPDISTCRLDLVAITPRTVYSEQAGDGQLGELTRASLAAEWPPEQWEPHVFEWLLKRFAEQPDQVGFDRYIALRDEVGARRLIGTLGGHMRSDANGDCEIGYGVLPEFQRKGYATEASQALIGWLRTRPGVRSISAQTFPYLPASIRVMEKCGMQFVEAGDEEGALRYRLQT